MSRNHEDAETHISKDHSPIHCSLDNCLEFSAAFSLGNLHQNCRLFSSWLSSYPVSSFAKGGGKENNGKNKGNWEEGKRNRVRRTWRRKGKKSHFFSWLPLVFKTRHRGRQGHATLRQSKWNSLAPCRSPSVSSLSQPRLLSSLQTPHPPTFTEDKVRDDVKGLDVDRGQDHGDCLLWVAGG